MWPPVPPPAIINTPLSPMSESPLARLLRKIEKQADRDEARDQRRSAVAHQRQRQSLGGHEAKRDADVDERLDRDHHGEPERGVEIEALLAESRDPEAAPNQKGKGRNHGDRADESQLLADNRENEVGVRLGKEEEFLPSVADAQPMQAAGTDRDERLHGLESLPLRIGLGIQKGQKAI